MSTGDQLKEIKLMLEDENDKQVRKITGGKLKNKEITSDKMEKIGKYLRCRGIYRKA